jgi:hypothetical protein
VGRAGLVVHLLHQLSLWLVMANEARILGGVVPVPNDGAVGRSPKVGGELRRPAGLVVGRVVGKCYGVVLRMHLIRRGGGESGGRHPFCIVAVGVVGIWVDEGGEVVLRFEHVHALVVAQRGRERNAWSELIKDGASGSGYSWSSAERALLIITEKERPRKERMGGSKNGEALDLDKEREFLRTRRKSEKQ